MWETFPPELWKEIFDLLSQQDHVSISRVSRHLHWQVQPHLYSKFTWVPSEEYMPIPLQKFERTDIQSLTSTKRRSHYAYPAPWVSAPSPYLLLRTLVKKPWLAQHFQDVELLAVPNQWGTFWEQAEARELGLSKVEFECLENTLWRTYRNVVSFRINPLDDEESLALMPYKDNLYKNQVKDLHEGRLALYTALVLSRMDNLRTMEIRLRPRARYEPTVYNPIFDCFVTPDGRRGLGKGLPKLTTVTIKIDKFDDSDYTSDYLDRDPYGVGSQIASLFQLKNIESLNINHIMTITHMMWSEPGYSPICQSLRKLKLHYGYLNHHDLLRILPATPNLVELDLHMFYDPSSHTIVCDELVAVLSKVKNTLERLVFTPFVFDLETGWEVVGSIESLRGFQKLKHLHFPLNLLLGNVEIGWGEEARLDLTKVLPASLQSFQHNDLDDQSGRIQDAVRRAEAEEAVLDLYDSRGWTRRRYWTVGRW